MPEFPENSLDLKRGTIIEAIHPAVAQLGLRIGDKIPIGFDGEYVRCQAFTWDVEQLCDEIRDGVWKVVGETDLSDQERNEKFKKLVEWT